IWFHPANVEILEILGLFVLYIPVFYMLVWLFRGLIHKEKRAIFINYTVGGLLLCYVVVLVFVYAVLPFMGIYIVNADVPFSMRAFVAEVSLALLRWMVYAGLFVLIEALLKMHRLRRGEQQVMQQFELQALGKELTAHTQFGLL